MPRVYQNLNSLILYFYLSVLLIVLVSIQRLVQYSKSFEMIFANAHFPNGSFLNLYAFMLEPNANYLTRFVFCTSPRMLKIMMMMMMRIPKER